MEHESFENTTIAKILNDNFVSIKVDREERPDVDKLYMSFIQSLTGGGGWPMSVFLTPDLEPITGGTYFPPHDSFGRHGFPTVLQMIADKWRNNNSDIKEQGCELAKAICEGVQQSKGKLTSDVDAPIQKCYELLNKKFDSKNGGFGSAPKFPKAVDLDFLLYFNIIKKSSAESDNSLKMLRLTLEKMFHGGIHDHVGKGFHRYSVDSIWHVPHFEKMLYDQGQLLRTYSNFYKITGELDESIIDIAGYIMENLSHPLGGFYSAEDADSLPNHGAVKKREGAFYVWSQKEIEDVLGDRPSRYNENICLDEIACAVFDVHEEGNVPRSADPHEELVHQNILHMVDKENIVGIAKTCKMTLLQLNECIHDSLRFLAEQRIKRPKPHLDNKIITGCNALAISGFCAAAQTMIRRAEFCECAERAIKFIKEHLVLDGELLRSTYVDDKGNITQITSPIKAFADDYVYLIEALIELYSLNLDDNLLKWACELQHKMDELFWDITNNSGYFISRAGDASIIARLQDEQDGAEPCTNSVAVSNLLRLSSLLGSTEFRKRAEDCFSGAAYRINKYPSILPRMLISLHSFAHPAYQIIVVGQSSDPTTNKMLQAIQSNFMPMATLIFIDKDKQEQWIVQENSHLQDYAGFYKAGQPTVYMCKEMACEMPIFSLDELQQKLNSL